MKPAYFLREPGARSEQGFYVCRGEFSFADWPSLRKGKGISFIHHKLYRHHYSIIQWQNAIYFCSEQLTVAEGQLKRQFSTAPEYRFSGKNTVKYCKPGQQKSGRRMEIRFSGSFSWSKSFAKLKPGRQRRKRYGETWRKHQKKRGRKMGGALSDVRRRKRQKNLSLRVWEHL